MRRADLKPDTVYRIVPWRGSAASYTGAGAFVRTTADLETVKEPTYSAASFGYGSHGGRTLVVVLPVEPAEPVDTIDKRVDVAPARVIDEVCSVADWPARLATIAEAGRNATADKDAKILQRREDLTLIIAGLLARGHAIDTGWEDFLAEMATDRHRRDVARIFAERVSDDVKRQAGLIVAAAVSGDPNDYITMDRHTARRIFGQLSTETR